VEEKCSSVTCKKKGKFNCIHKYELWNIFIWNCVPKFYSRMCFLCCYTFSNEKDEPRNCAHHYEKTIKREGEISHHHSAILIVVFFVFDLCFTYFFPIDHSSFFFVILAQGIRDKHQRLFFKRLEMSGFYCMLWIWMLWCILCVFLNVYI
jgi:hypothetical protein